MTTAQQNLAALGYRLPTEAEHTAMMEAHHRKNAELYARVGNDDMARQALALAEKVAATA